MAKPEKHNDVEIVYINPTDLQQAPVVDAMIVGEVINRCTICQAQLVDEDLFCPNCGTEAPEQSDSESQAEQSKPRTEIVQHHFSCQSCGASMSYDAQAQNLRCPFCSSERIKKDKASKTLKAKYVVPFHTDRDDIMKTLRSWFGSSFWRPSDLVSQAVVTQMTAVYVPYWVFQAKAYTNWSADSSNVPWGSRGDWMPVTGKHHGDYSGVLVGASSVLSPLETSSICPYNLATGQPLEQSDLENYVVEQFRVQRKYARPLARTSIQELERETCRKYVPGRARNVKVNVRLHGISSEPVLLPLWILAYRYNGELYRFLANGQTGRHTGTAPVSWTKIIMMAALVIAAVLFILAMISGIAMFSG